MANMNLQDTITLARMVTAGIRKHGEEVSKVGISESDAERLDAMNNDLIGIDTRQEQLKADLKSTTEALGNKRAELGAELLRIKRLVKVTIPQSQWNDFGITDKR